MKTHHLNECRSCGGMSIGVEERTFCDKCLNKGDRVPLWVNLVSFISALIIVLMMASCSEEDPTPVSTCIQLKADLQKAQQDYDKLAAVKLVMPTLKQAAEWTIALKAAQDDYKKAKVLYENCGK